jgi:hypothetical protein
MWVEDRRGAFFIAELVEGLYMRSFLMELRKCDSNSCQSYLVFRKDNSYCIFTETGDFSATLRFWFECYLGILVEGDCFFSEVLVRIFCGDLEELVLFAESVLWIGSYVFRLGGLPDINAISSRKLFLRGAGGLPWGALD